MKGQNGFSVVTCKFQIPKICEIKYSLEFKLGIENKNPWNHANKHSKHMVAHKEWAFREITQF